MMVIFCGGGGGLVFGGGALLIVGSSACDDLGGVSTGDEVMLTQPPELAHCGRDGRVCNFFFKYDQRYSKENGMM